MFLKLSKTFTVLILTSNSLQFTWDCPFLDTGFKVFILCVRASVCACRSMWRSQSRVRSPGTRDKYGMSHQVDAVNQTWGLCKRSKYS